MKEVLFPAIGNSVINYNETNVFGKVYGIRHANEIYVLTVDYQVLRVRYNQVHIETDIDTMRDSTPNTLGLIKAQMPKAEIFEFFDMREFFEWVTTIL